MKNEHQLLVCLGLVIVITLLIYSNILSRLNACCCCCCSFFKKRDKTNNQTQSLINNRQNNIIDDYNSL